MKNRSSRAIIECAALEARRLFCMDHDIAGFSTSPPDDDVGGVAVFGAPSGSSGPESVDVLTVPAYSSRPGANRKLYLDFNGHGAIDNWNGWWEFGGKSVTATQAYDIDGNNNAYSNQEVANILQIWKGVSEKYSPFDLDVTTVRPSTINGVRVVIGGDGAWYGKGGGVASIGGWGEEGFTDVNSGNVAFVWNGQTPTSNPNYIIDAASHEAGHTLDLYHHSFPPISIKTNEYATGFIMGSGGRWANTAVSGTVATSRNDDGVQNEGSQNDLTRITSGNGFTFRADDVGNSIGVATTLTLTSGSGVLEGAAAGVIEQMPDLDVYRINHTGGSLDVEVLAAEFGRMLDPRMALLNSSNQFVEISTTNDGSDGVGERIQINQLNAGTYYILINGSGAYGDIGQYRLNARAGLVVTAFNDTVSTATQLYAFGNTDATVWGPIGYGGTSTINDSLASTDTIDYYKFRAPGNTKQVYVRLGSLTTSASVALYNDLNGNGIIEIGEILNATNPGTGDQFLTSSTVNGNTMYYVRVMKASAAGAGNYQLRINTDAAPATLPSSVSPATFDPQPLVGGKFVYESIDALASDTTDYYRVTAEVSGLFSFYLNNVGSGDLRLDVGRDTNANGVLDGLEITNSANSPGTGSSEFLQNVVAGEAQTYLVRVTPQVAGSSSNYSLQAIADYATGGNVNGSLVGARDLTARLAGTIYEYLGESVDFFDTFKIAPPIGQMQARFNGIDLGANHRLEIVRDGNNNGAVEAGEVVASGFTGQLLSYSVIAGGTYYLRVATVFSGEFFSNGNYKLTYNTNGAINTWTTPATAGNITVLSTQSFLVNYLGYDPADATQNNTEDYFRFTLAGRSRFDVSINGPGMGVAVGQDDGFGNFRRIGGVGTNQGVVTSLSVNLNPGTYLIRTYLPVEERQEDPSGGNYGLFFKTAAVTDNSPPLVTASAFQYEIKPTGVSFTMNQDIAGSIDVADVVITAIDGSQIAIGGTFYDAATHRIGYTVANGVLPDGNYRATLLAGSVRDASANPLAAAYDLNFFALAGDANRDRAVNLDDFTRLASSFGQTNRTFSNGDFNYDRTVSLDDFTILASKFGTVLAAAPLNRTPFNDGQLTDLPTPAKLTTSEPLFGNRRDTMFSDVLLDPASV